MKKTLIFLLVIASIFTFAACTSKAPDTGSFECEFNEEEKTATVTGYNGEDEVITIPSAFGNYTVTEIGRNAFKENYNLTEINLPDTLKKIGPSAFELCISLEKVELPDGLETLAGTAFANCRGLEVVLIGSELKDIGLCAFTGCTSLEQFSISKGNESFYSYEGALFTKNYETLLQYPLGNTEEELTLPDKTTVIASYAFEKSQNLERITAKNVKVIESYAFQASSVKEADLGDGLTEIGNFAFNESKIKSFNFGSSLKNIGNSGFSWCMSLEAVSLPATLEELGTSAFYMCTAVTAYSVAEGNNALSSDEKGVLFNKDKTVLMCYPAASKAEEYAIPATVTEIAANAFTPCLGIKKVTVPDSVEKIGEKAFAQCTNLKDVIYEGTQPTVVAPDAFEK